MGTKYRKNEQLLEAIGARIRELRKDRQSSQQKMNATVNLAIGRLELGRHNVGIVALSDLCYHLGITLSEFFRDIEATPSDTLSQEEEEAEKQKR